MLDYLVVGLGLAGISFCEQMEEHGKTFHVISDDSQTSSSVAGGLYNPVILKRFTLAWKANEQLALAVAFYGRLEKKLCVSLDYKLPIVRRFHSAEEQNLWFEAMDKPFLRDFLSADIQSNINPHVDAPYGFGTVLKTGRIATRELLTKYAEYLTKRNALSIDKFDYQALQMENGAVSYKSLKARRIVFAEGFGLQKNPFFNYLPMNGNKGEYVIIEAPELKEEKAIKSSIFCIPLGKNKYMIGANYNRNDTSNTPSETTKKELLQKMEQFVKCDYKVVGQVAGVRPTVVDRKPLIGQHPDHDRLFVLNGFGSRGVLIGPYASLALFDYIERQKPLDPEVDIVRFRKKYFKG
jgi:glycine/D-amino acid oxidase-like deaminating enzyme